MSSNPPVNPTNQPPLPVEQVPPDITIPIYAPSSKTKNPLSFLFNLLKKFRIIKQSRGIFLLFNCSIES